MTTPTTAPLDVRRIPPRERHALIFGSFDALAPGQTLELVNDHDPLPLRDQLEDRSAGQLEWTYLQAGPDLWHVRIGRRAAGSARAVAAGDSCCSGGACGGG